MKKNKKRKRKENVTIEWWSCHSRPDWLQSPSLDHHTIWSLLNGQYTEAKVVPGLNETVQRKFVGKETEDRRDVRVCVCVCVCVHQPESSLNIVLLRFLEASSHRHNQLWTPFPAPLPILEKCWRGRGAENSKLLIMAWSLWVTGPHPRAIRSPPRVASLEQKMLQLLLLLRNWQGFGSPGSGSGSDINTRTRDDPSVLIT